MRENVSLLLSWGRGLGARSVEKAEVPNISFVSVFVARLAPGTQGPGNPMSPFCGGMGPS